MITCSKLQSSGFRLGNQLFMISAVVAHAQKMGVDFALPPWTYSDQIFPNHVGDEASLSLIPRYHEPRFHFMPLPELSNLNLSGFFQSPLYFDNVKDKIRDEFLGNSHRDMIDACAVHVRRGDYLEPECRLISLPMSYYEATIDVVRMFEPRLKFVVFSDDPSWCANYFAYKKNVTVYKAYDALTDLREISRYRFIITANSSFSLWASLLSRGAKVFYPSLWFKDESINTKDMYMPEWNRIQTHI